MTQNSGRGVIIEQVNVPEDKYASSSLGKFTSESEEKGLKEGNAFLRALFGGSPDLAGMNRLPPSSVDLPQHVDEEVSLNKSQFSFLPYDCKLPCLVRARVTGKVSRKLYMVRDVEILTYLYEHITRPSTRLSTALLQNPDQKIPCLARVVRQFSDDKQRRSNPRLYRGIASNFDCDSSSCTVYLVDYGEQIDCSAFLVYDLNNQTTPVTETRAAAFKFQLNGVLLDGKCCPIDFEMRDSCNYDLRLTEKDGEVFVGYVCMQSETELGGSVIPHSMKHEEGDRKVRKAKELERKRAEIDEKSKNLRTERQLFELQAYERQQELMLMMIQLQFAQVSQKIDMLANNALYRSALGSCWNSTAPMFPLMIPPYIHYPLGMPMINQLVQSVENSSMSQLQNVPFNSPSFLPSFVSQQYPFIDGLVRERPSGDGPNDNVSINSQINNVTEKQQVSENIVQRRKQNLDTGGGQGASSSFRNNIFNGHGINRKDHGRLYPEEYSKLNLQSSLSSNKLNVSCLDAKRDSREFRKPEYGEPPRFLLESNNSKKQTGVFQARNDASYGSRSCEKNSGTFNENGKVLEFRNSGRTQRAVSSPRPAGRTLRQVTKRCRHIEEERTVEISILKSEISEAVTISVPQSENSISPLPNMEKQSKDTNSSSARRRGSLDLEEECVSTIPISPNHLMKSLHYVEHVPHMDVDEGREYLVKRSDDDRTNSEWPLFFVQIQDEKVLDLIMEHFDSLHSDDILPESEVVVGKLCLSYCHAFQAMFRAVITAVMETDVEVHYIDYGNYENVTRSELRTINDQSEITRTHKAVAVPCIIRSLAEVDQNSAEELLEEDIAAIKEAVACDDERSFILRFLSKRPDGVRLVELVKPSLPI